MSPFFVIENVATKTIVDRKKIAGISARWGMTKLNLGDRSQTRMDKIHKPFKSFFCCHHLGEFADRFELNVPIKYFCAFCL
jgi:hypothetical protein